MRGETEAETIELKEMFSCAQSYLRSHRWLAKEFSAHFGFGIGGVVAIFLFHIELDTGEEEWLWVIEGDLPSAYLVTDSTPTPAEALEAYANLMEEWTNAVRQGSDLENVFPVNAPADEEHVELLEIRIKLLREHIIPAARS
ncbi:MAG: DUF4826 family protein [Planctomycetota bacterium]|nr:MAG: DUF4826 family protein [Planctomycetota bacterium]